mgnify:CR=1 FL=1
MDAICPHCSDGKQCNHCGGWRLARTLPPVRVIAQRDSLSIVSGREYEFHEYTDHSYRVLEERVPSQQTGTLCGIGGSQPTCVAYPKWFTSPVDPPAHLEWI